MRMTGFDYIENWVDQLLMNEGVSHDWAIYLRLLLLVIALLIIAAIGFYFTKIIVLKYLYKVVKKSRVKWDDLLADKDVFNNMAHIVPAIFVRLLAPGIFNDFETVLPFIIKLTDVYLIIVALTILIAALKTAEFNFAQLPAFKNKPLTSYFQLVRILCYIAAAILLFSILLGKSPVYFLSAFGAMTAIVLLIFKDTILGLVASVQMSTNDMVRVGDWIEMPKFNADGDVMAINLNTVKIRNFDKTITTIPTYYFISDSFKNWRGMLQSGGRRIKRSIFIDANSIHFVNAAAREELKKIHLIADFITNRQQAIEVSNDKHTIDTSVLINGRRMTNIGIFRHYIEIYLQSHPGINKKMTIMVRQLALEDKGIPLEIYCFANTTVWHDYENIQADIFDHLFAAGNFFEVSLFQQPSGKDISVAVQNWKVGAGVE
jgi:miniconductance mechanosensitive channel